jgi:transcriptional regulator with XRE-family HTH domain
MSAALLIVRQNGAAIRALRRKDGQSVSDLAESVGLSAQGLTNIENEFRQASPEALNRIARALSVPVAAITRTPVPAENTEDAENGSSAA